MKPQNSEHALVIKTNSYAGNFERELCAFTTGQIGECEVGKKYVERHIEEIFEEVIGQEAEDNCYRPVAIASNYGIGSSNDVAIFFENYPDKELIEIIESRAEIFANEHSIEILGMELYKFSSSFHKVNI